MRKMEFKDSKRNIVYHFFNDTKNNFQYPDFESYYGYCKNHSCFYIGF